MRDYHDRFFKELFSVKAHAVELAAHLLPAAVAGNLDVAPAVEKGGDEVMTTAQKLRDEGFKIGRQKGWQDGRQEGSQHLLSNLVMGMRKRGLDAAQIAENLGLDPTLVTRVINRESVEIPLYLLGQDRKND